MWTFAKIIASMFSGIGVMISVAMIGLLIVMAFFSPVVLGFVFVSASALLVVKIVAVSFGFIAGLSRFFLGRIE